MTRKLITTSILFFVVADAALSWLSYGSYFCAAERTGHNLALTVVRLAFALTAWNFFAVVCGPLVLALGKRHVSHVLRTVAPAVSTVIGGVGYISIVFLIYRGPGTFWLENTWADVSCFFTEENAMKFLFVIAPSLAVTTLICEWLVL